MLSTYRLINNLPPVDTQYLQCHGEAMSRTTRTLPRWVQQQITSTNNLMNGYRGLKYYTFCADYIKVDGKVYGSRLWKRDRGYDTANNERTAYLYSTDNGQRNLRNCNHSLPIGKACGWIMSEASSQGHKKSVRKQWARANRRWSALVIREEMELMEYDNEDDRLDQEKHANDYFEDEYYVDYDADYYDPAAQYSRGHRDGFARGLAEGYMKAFAEFNSIKRVA